MAVTSFPKGFQMTDLVERLRCTWEGRPYLPSICEEAADEIERLNAAYEQLRETYLQAAEQLAEATAEIEKLRELWENSPSAAR